MVAAIWFLNATTGPRAGRVGELVLQQAGTVIDGRRQGTAFQAVPHSVGAPSWPYPEDQWRIGQPNSRQTPGGGEWQ